MSFGFVSRPSGPRPYTDPPSEEDTPYHERQRHSDSCRVHAINAMLARGAETRTSFHEWVRLWHRDKGLVENPTLSYFAVDGTSAVSARLEWHGMGPVVTLGLGHASELLRGLVADVDQLYERAGRYCLFDTRHIFAVVRHHRAWWVVDSLDGRARRGRVMPARKYGLIIPVPPDTPLRHATDQGAPYAAELNAITSRLRRADRGRTAFETA